LVIKQNYKTIHYGLELDKFKTLILRFMKRIVGRNKLPEIFNLVRTTTHPDARLVLIGGDSYDIATQSQSTWQLLQQNFKKKT
jgi:hypothetical protein